MSITPHSLRAEYPGVTFETRPLYCADGLTRMMVLTPWYWDKLELLLDVDTADLQTITQFCLSLAELSVEREGWEHEHAFRELLMYYIYRNYNGFVQVRDQIANDTGADCYQ